MKFNFKTKKAPPLKKKASSTEKMFVGEGWSVMDDGDGVYIFEYLNGGAEGGVVQKYISKEDYLLVRNGLLGYKELFQKY